MNDDLKTEREEISKQLSSVWNDVKVLKQILSENHDILEEIEGIINGIVRDDSNEETDDQKDDILNGNHKNKNTAIQQTGVQDSEREELENDGSVKVDIKMDEQAIATLESKTFGEKVKFTAFKLNDVIKCEIKLYPKGNKDREWMVFSIKLEQISGVYEVRKVELDYLWSNGSLILQEGDDEWFYFDNGCSERYFRFIRVDFIKKLLNVSQFEISVNKTKYRNKQK